jgi:uncharacterized protein YoxC
LRTEAEIKSLQAELDLTRKRVSILQGECDVIRNNNQQLESMLSRLGQDVGQQMERKVEGWYNEANTWKTKCA